MTPLCTSPTSARLSWLPRAFGLIGVDVGTCGLKLAQLQQTKTGWRFQACAQFEYGSGHFLTRESLLNNGLASVLPRLQQAGGIFSGRDAAAALPSCLATLRSFEFPSGPMEDHRLMVEQELAEDVASSGHEFAAWIGLPGSKTDRVIAVSADHEISLKLAKELLAARLRTKILDAAPCALARAVALVESADDELAAVLDLGYSTSLFMLVRGGQPLYCRTFRGCGMQALQQAIETQLKLSAGEGRHLVGRYGVSFGAQQSAAKATGQACEGVLNLLVDEVLRTLLFGQSQLRIAPTRLWLAGPGGVIPNLAAILQESLELPTSAWRLPGSDDADDAVYATAAGLSALAWENSPCT